MIYSKNVAVAACLLFLSLSLYFQDHAAFSVRILSTGSMTALDFINKAAACVAKANVVYDKGTWREDVQEGEDMFAKMIQQRDMVDNYRRALEFFGNAKERM